MTISARNQAILLLTAQFGKGKSGADRPLTPTEYGRLAKWLSLRSLMPERLLIGNLGDVLEGWKDEVVSFDRIGALLDRGSALGISAERWLRTGLWVMTRSDSDYPKRLEKRLGDSSPAVLFGCGNRALLNSGGLAVVGSRKVEDADLAYSRKIGELAAAAGVSIVSGGARGVDETAMLGAINAEGTAVGVLADNLMRACSRSLYRRHLLESNLALVSPFNPEAGFSVGNAMQRNKYIYCLADAALAVYSGRKGGTWSGAQEDLRRGWVPLWVKPTANPEAGNRELIDAGACEAPGNVEEVKVDSFFVLTREHSAPVQDLFYQGITAVRGPSPASESGLGSGVLSGSETADELAHTSGQNDWTGKDPEGTMDQTPDPSQVTLYEFFLVKVKELCASEPRSAPALADALGLNRTQVNVWLKQAVEDGELKKLLRPVRYEVDGTRQGTLALE